MSGANFNSFIWTYAQAAVFRYSIIFTGGFASLPYQGTVITNLHSFVKTALLTSDTSLNIWLALNTVTLSLLVALFELTRRYVQKTDTHK